MDHQQIAMTIYDSGKVINLIYAFNSTGKTRLSIAYKDYTKSINNGSHSGVYYNAYSEDLFVWKNDDDDVRLTIEPSSLNDNYSYIKEIDVRNKLAIYSPKFDFQFNPHPEPENGHGSVTFFKDQETKMPIKISRSEERLFVWCFFQALFEVSELAATQNKHFFIDDPVSSLDEHNIFLTAESILDLIDAQFPNRRIVITTHHIGLFTILFDKLKRGEKSSRYRGQTQAFLLSSQEDILSLESIDDGVFLFHLHLLKTLDAAINSKLFAYHFVLLRQLLENISSFLGESMIKYVLLQANVPDADNRVEMINSLSHKDAFQRQFYSMSDAEETVFKDVFTRVRDHYKFVY